MMQPKEPDSFMKSAKGVINLLIVAFLAWVGLSVQQSTTAIAVLSVQIKDLEDAVKEAKGSAADRYTASSAVNDFHARDMQIQQNISRIDGLSDRIRNLEIAGARKK